MKIADEPDDAARKKTRAFIGDRSRAHAVLERHGAGALRIDIDGDGHARVDFGGSAERCEVRVSESRIFDAFVNAAFTEIVIARGADAPDAYDVLRLEGVGGTHEVRKLARTEHARFDRLVRVIADVVGYVLTPEMRAKLSRE